MAPMLGDDETWKGETLLKPLVELVEGEMVEHHFVNVGKIWSSGGGKMMVPKLFLVKDRFIKYSTTRNKGSIRGRVIAFVPLMSITIAHKNAMDIFWVKFITLYIRDVRETFKVKDVKGVIVIK